MAVKIVWGRSLNWNIDYNRARMSYNGANKFNPSPGKKYMEYTIITNGADCYPWYEVFAWYPVRTINGKRVWWKKIFKRKIWVIWGTGFHMEPEVQYATAFDLLMYNDNNYTG